jgi:hypothetical protein
MEALEAIYCDDLLLPATLTARTLHGEGSHYSSIRARLQKLLSINNCMAKSMMNNEPTQTKMSAVRPLSATAVDFLCFWTACFVNRRGAVLRRRDNVLDLDRTGKCQGGKFKSVS